MHHHSGVIVSGDITCAGPLHLQWPTDPEQAMACKTKAARTFQHQLSRTVAD